jgi:hypothetical protein
MINEATSQDLKGAVIEFSQLREKIEFIQNSNKDAIFIELYMFSMATCPPCVATYRMLFGADINSEHNVWRIVLKKFYDGLQELIKKIIEKKMEKFKENSNVNLSLGHIYEYLYNNSDDNIYETKMNTLVKYLYDNIIVTFVKIDREKNSDMAAIFNVYGFPSFTFCADAKLLPEPIKYKNNRVPLRAGAFMGVDDFMRWFDNNIAIIIDSLCDSILPTWIIKNKTK